MVRQLSTISSVERWTSKLPLATKLAEKLPDNLLELCQLTDEDIKVISNSFTAELEILLKNHCKQLKIALSCESSRTSNLKYTYTGNFGRICDFHKLLYDDIGAPNPDWENAMRKEHASTAIFKSTNFEILTSPQNEWNYLVENTHPPQDQMNHGRIIKDISSLLLLQTSIDANLKRPEIIALVLYTGPMFTIYNCILRKYPHNLYSELKGKGSLFSTTIFVLVSAIQKVAKVMQLSQNVSLFRGTDGNMALPDFFHEADTHGCMGIMEYGFMSTTINLHTAISYTGIDQEKVHPKVFKIQIGSVDRGADISEFSQYQSEQEFLWLPHSFLEPTGEISLELTEYGIVEIISVRVNSNLKAILIEEYVARKKELHLTSFKFMLHDLHIELTNMLTDESSYDKTMLEKRDSYWRLVLGDKVQPQGYLDRIMDLCNALYEEHKQVSPEEYNKDEKFRSLVSEMLECKGHAITKLESFLTDRSLRVRLDYHLPLILSYRHYTSMLNMKIKKKGKKKTALLLCKKLGIVIDRVDEVDLLGETPLFKVCANGESNAIDLLVAAGADVSALMSYPLDEAKVEYLAAVSPLFIASYYGHDAVIEKLVQHGGRKLVHDRNTDGDTPVFIAAWMGHCTTVELLARLGCDIHIPNKDGWTPVAIAARSGSASTVQILLQLGGQVNTPNTDQQTPLFLAARSGYVSVAEMLLVHGGDIDQTDKEGQSPLFVAAKEGHMDVVKTLIRCGANLSILTHLELSALDIARQNGHTEIAALLQSAAASKSGVEREYLQSLKHQHVQLKTLSLDKADSSGTCQSESVQSFLLESSSSIDRMRAMIATRKLELTHLIKEPASC